MSRFIATPRLLDAMMKRPTLSDLIAHPGFSGAVDLSDLPCFDPRDVYHQALADVISEGVYRHQLILEELSKQHAFVDASPLVCSFQTGLARARIALGPGGGKNVGAVLFERDMGGVPRIFKPGRWLMRFREMQDEEDEAIYRLLRKKVVSPTGDPNHAAIDDSDIFEKPVLGFRQNRQVVLPGQQRSI